MPGIRDSNISWCAHDLDLAIEVGDALETVEGETISQKAERGAGYL
ncbi:MAG: hypothetical protein V3U84_07010 [Thiotrichaceae bacterium]